MKSVTYLGSLAAVLILCATSRGADWITAPSYYTHDPQLSTRVDQYTPIGPFYTFARTDYLQSGYRQTRSTIRAGQSMDQMHIVEEWGRPVRPYGEWQFPFRPYSVPYQLWGIRTPGWGAGETGGRLAPIRRVLARAGISTSIRTDGNSRRRTTMAAMPRIARGGPTTSA